MASPLRVSTSCPACGKEVKKTDQFCGGCGYNLSGEARPAEETSTEVKQTSAEAVPVSDPKELSAQGKVKSHPLVWMIALVGVFLVLLGSKESWLPSFSSQPSPSPAIVSVSPTSSPQNLETTLQSINELRPYEILPPYSVGLIRLGACLLYTSPSPRD